MDRVCVGRILKMLERDEIAEALELVSVIEQSGRTSHEAADAWRRLIRVWEQHRAVA